LQFIEIDADATPESYYAYYRVAEHEYRRYLESEAEAQMPEGFYNGIMEC
jgi:hypothetical protein